MATKILLADDSIVIQKVAQLTFAETEYEVTTVGDGETALQKILEIKPDIVLLDPPPITPDADRKFTGGFSIDMELLNPPPINPQFEATVL